MKSTQVQIGLISARNSKNNKIKSVLIVESSREEITVLSITHNFMTMAETEQSKYYEIKDYEHTGLDLLSWVDVTKTFTIKKDKINLVIVGDLQPVDMHGINEFKRQFEKRRSERLHEQYRNILSSIIKSL